ncbi:ATP-dependent helicase [Nakamurella antarctica]|uniref:DNA 3'-5' helicase n=1 Tax=Nakamurella antarctica TaxID=1902245 RepID=A0A3G8ZVU4_9ACTN|nr:UvrD-helicase domain-containing protein [Nakamurella antarctica]AZI58136.1 ATP-dependent helicase [Nakamurella antarctica]
MRQKKISALELSRALGQEFPPTREQIAVIEADLSPLLVVAGAGSGKTETMAARVVYLIANGWVLPEDVLGLTFTRKAASQLLQRIRSRLAALAASGLISADLREHLLATEPQVWTYHAFGGRLISEFGTLVGVEPTARILSATGSWQLAGSVVRRWDQDLRTDLTPDRVTERLLNLSGVLADHLRTPAELEKLTLELAAAIEDSRPTRRQTSAIHSKLVSLHTRLTNRSGILPLVEAFRQAKRAAGVLDFGDQMQLAAELVREQSRVGAELRHRHKVVLLDEYQDTGHSQREILTFLFGSKSGAMGHPVTAVGDPCQSIYSWRGASASNLPRFITDFPQKDGADAGRASLLTSFRNPSDILTIANSISAPIRSAPVAVDVLTPRLGASRGQVRYGLFATSLDENTWVADTIAHEWRTAQARSAPPPTTAVLFRRRSAMAGIADLLTERGIPVEITGLAGLLNEPEIIDLVSTLQVLVEPAAGGAAIRILTGARWRLGLADLAALQRRARQLSQRPATGRLVAKVSSNNGDDDVDGSHRLSAVRSALTHAQRGESFESAGLVDAISDPGPGAEFSTEGFDRIRRLGSELQWLRRRLAQPLTDVVADIEHTIGLDIEAPLAGTKGRTHLDAFAQVVADFSGQASPTGSGASGSSLTAAVDLLEFLRVAADAENGLAPGEVEQSDSAVQLMTVHAAKGLEWQLVAVPQLAESIFPGVKGLSWLSDDGQLPPSIRGDREDLPQLDLSHCLDQGEICDAVEEHKAAWKAAQLTEERRLLYVALTRSEGTLVFSSHWWSYGATKYRGPSAFFGELADAASAVAVPDEWADRPLPDEANPLLRKPRSALWPADPLGGRRAAVETAASMVRTAVALRKAEAAAPTRFAKPPALSEAPETTQAKTSAAEGPPIRVLPSEEAGVAREGDDPRGWKRDVDALIAEKKALEIKQFTVELPSTVSVSALVALARDPARLAQNIRRPLPVAPSVRARRGTAFHQWLERYYAGEALLDLAELPGADFRDTLVENDIESLRRSFLTSPWADRVPQDQEVPFAMMVGDLPVRGRIDAVFSDADGGWTVVDWKTGQQPDSAGAAAAAVQLAAYRLAWAQICGCDVEEVRAAFHYVPSGITVSPTELLDEAGLFRLVEAGTSSLTTPERPEIGAQGAGVHNGEELE